MDLGTYRARFGLNRKQSLIAPVLGEARRVEGLRRWESNELVRTGLEQGREMARTGVLHDLGRAAQPPGTRRAQGRLAASREGASVALRADRDARAAAARERWTQQAQDLGFDTLQAYLAARVRDGSSAHRVRTELGCGGSVAVRLLAQMDDAPGRR
ncbi:hypothetical protein NOCARDAX2BIS_720011 [Nocardioides sp. AX2bis]|nr:hypothetical protein NOCARDAX2BIS_720011 [Nocardioides sp. AX2bis]